MRAKGDVAALARRAARYSRTLRSIRRPAARSGRPPWASRWASCARGVGQLVAGGVEHPGLEHGAAAGRLADAQHARLLGEVGQRRGRASARSRPPRWAAPRCGCDACGRPARRASRGCASSRRSSGRAAGRAGQRLMGEDEHPAVAGALELASDERDLGRVDHAARAALALDRVEHDRAHARAEVERRSPAARPPRRAVRPRPRSGPSRRRPGSGAVRARAPGQAAAEQAVDRLGRQGALAALHAQRGVGRDRARGRRGPARRSARCARARRRRAGRGCPPPDATARAARARGTGAGRAASRPGWRGGSTSGR